MIQLFRKIILLSIPLILLACGGGGWDISEDTSGGGETSNTVTMVINASYTLSSGDKILPTSTNPDIRIEKSSNSNSSNVTLLSGSAQITRG